MPDVRHVVKGRNVLARPGDRDTVEQFEEVEIELGQDCFGSPLFRGQFRPAIERGLGSAEDFFNAGCGVQLLGKNVRLTFIGEGQLVAQVIEAVVDRGRRQHEDFGFDPGPDDLVHQLLITGFLLLEGVIVPEIVGFVDDDEVVIAPVYPVQRDPVGGARCPRQVGMAQHIIVESVPGEGVGFEVGAVVEPVVRQLLRAKHENRAIAQFVIFDDGKRGEGFAEAYAVCENASIIGFQLVDDAGCRVALVVEQLLPDEALLIAGAVVRQDVLVNVFQKRMEDIVEHNEVDALWGVLLVDRGNVIADRIGYIFDPGRIRPDRVEQLNIALRVRRLFEPIDEV